MNIDKIISAIEPPIVEIGGPTPEGYEFLKHAKTELSEKPIITNTTKVVVHNPFGSHPEEFGVDEVVDVKSMPYEAESVGMIISCNLPFADSDKNKDFATDSERREYLESHKQKANLEYENFLKNQTFTLNLHLALIEESQRALRENGFLVIEGYVSNDISAAESCNFTLVWQSEQSIIFQKNS